MLMGAILMGCMHRAAEPLPEKSAFVPYAITDSSKITTYPDGLQLYVVSPGPGDYPQNGDQVTMQYVGYLADGTVFDDSYQREKPFSFSIGGGRVIAGIDAAVRKLRLGSKAILVVPPSLGYGDGTGDNKLPPKIPANATLTFHIDLIGSF